MKHLLSVRRKILLGSILLERNTKLTHLINWCQKQSEEISVDNWLDKISSPEYWRTIRDCWFTSCYQLLSPLQLRRHPVVLAGADVSPIQGLKRCDAWLTPECWWGSAWLSLGSRGNQHSVGCAMLVDLCGLTFHILHMEMIIQTKN